MTPAERVEQFLAARDKMNGLDPERIYEVGVDGERYQLLASDLRSLLAERGRWAIAKNGDTDG